MCIKKIVLFPAIVCLIPSLAEEVHDHYSNRDSWITVSMLVHENQF